MSYQEDYTQQQHAQRHSTTHFLPQQSASQSPTHSTTFHQPYPRYSHNVHSPSQQPSTNTQPTPSTFATSSFGSSSVRSSYNAASNFDQGNTFIPQNAVKLSSGDAFVTPFYSSSGGTGTSGGLSSFYPSVGGTAGRYSAGGGNANSITLQHPSETSNISPISLTQSTHSSLQQSQMQQHPSPKQLQQEPQRQSPLQQQQQRSLSYSPKEQYTQANQQQQFTAIHTPLAYTIGNVPSGLGTSGLTAKNWPHISTTGGIGMETPDGTTTGQIGVVGTGFEGISSNIGAMQNVGVGENLERGVAIGEEEETVSDTYETPVNMNSGFSSRTPATYRSPVAGQATLPVFDQSAQQRISDNGRGIGGGSGAKNDVSGIYVSPARPFSAFSATTNQKRFSQPIAIYDQTAPDAGQVFGNAETDDLAAEGMAANRVSLRQSYSTGIEGEENYRTFPQNMSHHTTSTIKTSQPQQYPQNIPISLPSPQPSFQPQQRPQQSWRQTTAQNVVSFHSIHQPQPIHPPPSLPSLSQPQQISPQLQHQWPSPVYSSTTTQSSPQASHSIRTPQLQPRLSPQQPIIQPIFSTTASGDESTSRRTVFNEQVSPISVSNAHPVTTNVVEPGGDNTQLPVTAFQLFESERRPQLEREHPTMQLMEISKLLSHEWANMDRMQKEEYSGRLNSSTKLGMQTPSFSTSKPLQERQITPAAENSSSKVETSTISKPVLWPAPPPPASSAMVAGMGPVSFTPAAATAKRSTFPTSTVSDSDALFRDEPERLKRPMNAYLLFNREMRHKLLDENPNMTVAELSREISTRWRSMDRATKEIYMQQARVLKEDFLSEHPGYVFRRRTKAEMAIKLGRKRRIGASELDEGGGGLGDDEEVDELEASPPASGGISSTAGSQHNAAANSQQLLKRRKRRAKDPKAPKHPMSGFFFFLSAMRPAIAAELPGSTVGPISKRIAEQWRSMSAEEREPWEEKARRDKERYARETQEYHAAQHEGVYTEEEELPSKGEEGEEELAGDFGDEQDEDLGDDLGEDLVDDLGEDLGEEVEELEDDVEEDEVDDED
ncbi:uncharacterized protein VTP21DRAFT_11449 [Calcarisporiella thermophila]|uniref:uncharacterized protein n=1 Tax=Calcarisporiella thermophila TaxID=911321 RepID=UPI003743C2F1